MGQINRIPNGFLDLLGTETGGKNPSQAPEVVAPVLTMNELYSSQTLESKNFGINSLAAGNNNFIIVPDSETWILYAVACNTIAPLVGDADQVGVYLDRLPRSAAPGNIAQIAQLNLLSIGVASTPADAATFPTPLVIGHGVRVVANIQQRAGGATLRVVNVNVTIGRLNG